MVCGAGANVIADGGEGQVGIIEGLTQGCGSQNMVGIAKVCLVVFAEEAHVVG
jgi:hypothetical protein